MRVFESCVSSEDIKYETGADKLFSYVQSGLGPMIVKDNKWIGFIEVYMAHLGSDFVIKKITIYKDRVSTKNLTEKYRGKILISSLCKDDMN